MSWGRASLFTKSTRVPGGTVISFGLTPEAVTVNVFGFDGSGFGAEGELPPHEATSTPAVRAAARIRMGDYAIRHGRQLPAIGYWMMMFP
jgi:hypothetical protein